MKKSFCQMIAIVCILATGFLTVTPFLPKAEADCGWYSSGACEDAGVTCAVKINSANRVCPGSNDAQITACEERTWDAYNACSWASWVCQHSG